MKGSRILFSAALMILLCGGLPARGQEVGAAAASGTAPNVVQHRKTMFDTIKAGGLMMIPLMATSMVMVGFVVRGFMTLSRKKMVPEVDVAQLRAFFSTGDYRGALRYCKAKPGFFNTPVAAGLKVMGQGHSVTEQAMGDALAKEVSTVSTANYYLNLIGVVTPMLGLTGTVLGMIKAFSTLGESGIGDPSKLAGAIGEVLVATAAGLFVAVPGFTFYYIFRNWITAATAYAEEHINLLFRAMPYEELQGMWFDDEPVFAALPQHEEPAPDQPAT